MKEATKGTTKTSAARTAVLNGQLVDLLTPQEFEAVTQANYAHPESRLILQLFLQVNYFWHVSRHLQDKRSHIKSVDWSKLE